VCLFRESKLLASATLGLNNGEKFTLRTAKAEGTFHCGLAEKTWCWLGFIPVLVFDCVALRLKEGISGLSPERKGTCFSCAMGTVWTVLGSFGIFSSLKKSTWQKRELLNSNDSKQMAQV